MQYQSQIQADAQYYQESDYNYNGITTAYHVAGGDASSRKLEAVRNLNPAQLLPPVLFSVICSFLGACDIYLRCTKCIDSLASFQINSN
jgi:hypothetical protein